jgi:hypothetical protein
MFSILKQNCHLFPAMEVSGCNTQSSECKIRNNSSKLKLKPQSDGHPVKHKIMNAGIMKVFLINGTTLHKIPKSGTEGETIVIPEQLSNLNLEKLFLATIQFHTF